jgi:hypothetical protein
MNQTEYIMFGVIPFIIFAIIPFILICFYWYTPIKYIILTLDDHYTISKKHEITTTTLHKKPYSFYLHKTNTVEIILDEDYHLYENRN